MSTSSDSKSDDSAKISQSSLNMKLQSYDLLTKSKLGYAVIFNNEKFEDKGIGLISSEKNHFYSKMVGLWEPAFDFSKVGVHAIPLDPKIEIGYVLLSTNLKLLPEKSSQYF